MKHHLAKIQQALTVLDTIIFDENSTLSEVRKLLTDALAETRHRKSKNARREYRYTLNPKTKP